jgi:hypothetical protein
VNANANDQALKLAVVDLMQPMVASHALSDVPDSVTFVNVCESRMQSSAALGHICGFVQRSFVTFAHVCGGQVSGLSR